MAKTLVQLENGVRVKYIIKEEAFMLFLGSANCFINGDYKRFKTQEDAVRYGSTLPKQSSYFYYTK